MLTKGDRVVMNNKYHVPERYRGKEFIVTAGPKKSVGQCAYGLAITEAAMPRMD